jgi:hypothetical protein
MADHTRLELFIDVLEHTNQRALALATITPPELVAAIIDEFQELSYLARTPAAYQLVKAEDRSLLDNDRPLNRQVAAKQRLILVEAEPPLPPGAQRPSRPIYLRDQDGAVYKLHWLPAIIGRPDPAQPHNDLIAVNLAEHSQGQRVSRRQAQISEEQGRFYLESLSQNQTTLRPQQGAAASLSPHTRLPLQHGDTIFLDLSQIALTFLVREKEGAP